MNDFFGQVYSAFKRRKLTYLLAVLALASGVAAYLCACSIIESQFRPLYAELGAAASQPPHFQVSVTARKKRRNLNDTDHNQSTGRRRRIRKIANGKPTPIDLSQFTAVVDQGFAKQHCIEAAFTTTISFDHRALNGVFVRALSNGDLHALLLYDETLKEGRLLTGDDTGRQAPVCVVNRYLAEILFPETDAVGRSIDIAGTSLQIVGVVGNGDIVAKVPQLFLPIELAFQLFPEERESLNGLKVVILADEKTLYNEMADAELILGVRAGQFWTPRADSPWLVARDNLVEINKNKMTLGVLAVGLLFIGLLGVTEMLLANIAGHIREIGVHRALGATRGRQAAEVLLQAGIVGFFGGLVGVAAGFGVVRLLENIFRADLLITGFWVAVAVVLSTLTSLAAGLIPARAAMRVSPMDALREE